MIWGLYSVLGISWIALTVVVWFFLLWGIVLLGLRNTRLESFFIRLWNRMTFRVFLAKLHIQGLENYDPRKPCIIISNHQSLLDIPTVYEVCSGPVKMLAKKELFRIPFFGWTLTAAGLIPVDRGNREASGQVLELMRKRIREGVQVWLAPEGTRSSDGHLGPFKGGAFRMAMELDLPIVALVFDGTRKALPKNAFVIRPFQEICVTVLPPVKAGDVGAKTYKDYRDYFQRVYQEVLQEGRSQDPSLR